MDERIKFVAECLCGEDTMSDLCKRYGVSRETGYTWLRRYDRQGIEGLKDQSKAPKHHPNAVSEELEDAIIRLRGLHPRWGPKKLRKKLRDEDSTANWPSVSTMGEILKRHGLVVARRKARPRATPSAKPLGDCESANQVWCADFKGWFLLGNGRRCDPLTITDGFSRFLLRCQALSGKTGFEYVRPLFEATFREYGLPQRIRTDNGPPFATVGLGGLSRLSVWWMLLGIVPERITPGCPQENGRHERMHRTLKAETSQPPAANLRAQQRAFDAFRKEFNEVRPHEALSQETPSSCYEASPREFPRRLLKVEYPHGWPTRSIHGAGQMRWKGIDLRISDALQGETIGFEPTEDGIWKIHFANVVLGLFDERKMKVVRPKLPPQISRKKDIP